jgi:hypothetical protein
MSSKPEPAPTAGAGTELWPEVIARHGNRPAFCRAALERHAFGVAKYGTGLRAFNGRNALIDALQEALDLVVYLEQARTETASRSTMMRLTAMQDLAVDMAQELALLSGV